MTLGLRFISVLAGAALLALVAGGAHGQVVPESLPETEGVGIVDRRGERVPSDIEIVDSAGRSLSTAELFDGERPVLLVLSYYSCPVLCPLILSEVQRAINGIDWTAGDEFRVVTVSFDHTELTEDALTWQQSMLLGYDREELADDAWVFHTADAENARRLAESVGFHYRYIPESGEFSHGAGIFFLSPDGEVSGFIENAKFDSGQVKLALQAAGDGKIGSLFDRFAFTCYLYDPSTGEYTVAVKRIMQLGGLATMFGLMALIGGLVWTNAVKKRREEAVRAGGGEAGERRFAEHLDHGSRGGHER